jgi:hypothetical protein
VGNDKPSGKRHRPIVGALIKLYRQRLGTIAWLEGPPKSMSRSWRGGDDFAGNESARLEQAEELKRDLHHILHVINIYLPQWDPATVRPIRPKSAWEARPPGGWTRAAMATLRECCEPLTIADIVAAICERHDIELATVAERARVHTAVNNGLKRTHDRQLEAIGGEPMHWWLKTRPRPSESNF